MLAAVGFKQMGLRRGINAVTDKVTIYGVTRQRILDRRSSIGKRAMSKCLVLGVWDAWSF